MAAKDDYLIEQLVDLGYVTNEQLDPLQAEAAAAGVGVIDSLVERKNPAPDRRRYRQGSSLRRRVGQAQRTALGR